MKKHALLFFLFFAALFFLSSAQSAGPEYTVNEEKVFIEFNTSYSLEDLVQLKKELKNIDVDINYSFLTFNNRGYLTRISASIDWNDGSKGSFESRELQSKSEPGPGFRRDFTKDPRPTKEK